MQEPAETHKDAKHHAAKKEAAPHRNNFHFYKMACCFVQQYRNCLIETLTRKFGPRKKVTKRDGLLDASELSQVEEPQPDLEDCITSTKSPECIPLICNDFLTSYLPLKCNLFN